MVAAPFFVGWRNVVPLWMIGIPLVGVFGYMLGFAIVFRLRHRSPEARAAYRERMLDTGPGANPHARTFVARKAIKEKDKNRVLRDGVDGTAVVTFIADGHMQSGFGHLVYLELDVTVGAGPGYQVRTGEYLTPVTSGTVAPGRRLSVKVHPNDPQQVAVDWERSLRLSGGTDTSG